jgi:hypothetical protein
MRARTLKTSRILSNIAASVAVALTFGAGNASADTLNYLLTTANLPGFTGPYADVTVNRADGTHATITFQSLTNGGYTYLMGDGGSVGVNVNGAFSLGAITGSNSLSGFTAGPYTNAGSGNEDGFGSFNQRITSFDGWGHSSTEISLGISATGLNSWSSAARVLTPNNKDQFAAIHFFACIPNGANGCTDASPGAQSITGFASGASVVPIPSAAWLFGSGLIGLVALVRRRSSASKLAGAA